MVWNSLVLLRRGLQMDCSKMESESSVFSWREYIWEISQERFTNSHTVVEINNMKRASRFRIPYQHKTFSNEVIKKQQDDKKKQLRSAFSIFCCALIFSCASFSSCDHLKNQRNHCPQMKMLKNWMNWNLVYSSFSSLSSWVWQGVSAFSLSLEAFLAALATLQLLTVSMELLCRHHLHYWYWKRLKQHHLLMGWQKENFGIGTSNDQGSRIFCLHKKITKKGKMLLY